MTLGKTLKTLSKTEQCYRGIELSFGMKEKTFGTLWKSGNAIKTFGKSGQIFLGKSREHYAKLYEH